MAPAFQGPLIESAGFAKCTNLRVDRGIGGIVGKEINGEWKSRSLMTLTFSTPGGAAGIMIGSSADGDSGVDEPGACEGREFSEEVSGIGVSVEGLLVGEVGVSGGLRRELIKQALINSRSACKIGADRYAVRSVNWM